MPQTNTTDRNIADALAEHMATPKEMGSLTPAGGGSVRLIALPNDFKLERVDDERFLANPRRAHTTAKLSDRQSFLAYVRQHATAATKVWCKFNPQSYELSFVAVIDDHHLQTPGWRGHLAVYTPDHSAEWKTWTGNDTKPKGQLEFAEFLERHADDINTGEGTGIQYPSSLDMLTMATAFQANSDKSIKSVVRLQSGGFRFDCIDDENAETRTQMQAFEKFMIGVPVFWADAGYRIEARLKYRNTGGKLTFWYELIRPDRAHETAARELIAAIAGGLAGNSEGFLPIPMLMGSCVGAGGSQ